MDGLPGRRPRAELRLTIFLGLCALLLPTFALGAPWLQNLRQLNNSNTRVSAMVVDLSDMSTIAALNPDMALTPASISKLFAAARALEDFGPDHRFVTRFKTSGSVGGGVLHGNLILVGGGDPALSADDLRSLVQKLKTAGVRYVTGNLIIDNQLFGSFTCNITDRCKARTRSAEAYSAPLSAAGVDFGTVEIKVYPGASVGDNTRVLVTPLGLNGYRIDNQVTTGATNVSPRLAVWRQTGAHGDILHLRGELPAGGRHYSIYRAVANADEQTRRVLIALLAEAGITIEGQALLQPVNHVSMSTLAMHKSDSLEQLLIPMLDYSNNYMADVLTLAIAANRGNSAPLTLAGASRTLRELAQRSLLESYPEQAAGLALPVFTSGSGLSVDNKLSARHMIALLNHMYHQTALFPAFYGAMPVPLSAAGRTLKHGNQQWLTRIAAKTGTLTEPVTVRALSGYFRMQNGNFGAFAVIINGTSQRPALTFHETVAAYQEDIEAILAAY